METITVEGQEDNKKLEHLEETVNDYLNSVRELEYSIMHFIKKSNKSTALNVRNAQREVSITSKEYKNCSIEFFDKEL